MKLLQFRSYLKTNNIDLVFLVHPDPNIIYFTQLKTSFALMLITPEDAGLYVTKLDRLPSMKNISASVLQKGWEKKIFKPNVKKIGINKSSLSVLYEEKLKKIYPAASFVDITATLNNLRSQKTPEEIKKIAKACAITSQAFDELVNQFSVKRFKTEKDIAFFLDKFICEHGADPAFPTIVASAENSAVPHHITSTSRIQKGFLQLDFGANYDNYCSDMSRILYFGKPSKAEIEHYDILLDAQSEAVRQAALNRPFTELDQIARKKLGKYSSHFIHSLGHGVGVEIHEQPSFSPEAKNTIKQNQIFTIEPGIYFPRKYGIRIEDTLLFKGRIKSLTTASKELIKVK
ncbi:MAG: aminopeptidase P family protein [Nanoarchaeota archaeon]